MLPAIPGPLRRLVLDGLDRLIHHLLALTEEVRRGVIDAVSRAVSESVERVCNAVIRRRDPSVVGLSHTRDTETFDEPDWSESEEEDNGRESLSSCHFLTEDEDERLESGSAFQVDPGAFRFSSPQSGIGSWRLAMATGLSGLATWLSKAGLTRFATATAMLAGTILLFPR